MSSLRKSLVCVVLAVCGSIASACTLAAPTNMSSLSWTYCSNTNELNVANAGPASVFVRFEITSGQEVKKVTATIHPNKVWTTSVKSEPSKVKVTDWVTYQVHK